MDDSLRLLSLLKEVAPDEVEVFVKMGELLLKSGNVTAALRSYNTAAEIDPDHPKVLEALDRLSNGR